jgi:hypothetical protein
LDSLASLKFLQSLCMNMLHGFDTEIGEKLKED